MFNVILVKYTKLTYLISWKPNIITNEDILRVFLHLIPITDGAKTEMLMHVYYISKIFKIWLHYNTVTGIHYNPQKWTEFYIHNNNLLQAYNNQQSNSMGLHHQAGTNELSIKG